MTEIIHFLRRWERDNVNRVPLGTPNGGVCRAPEQEGPPLEQSRRERLEHSQAPVLGEHSANIVELAKLRQNRVLDAIPVSLFLEAPLRPLREGEACITSDYTGTAEAAILSLPGILLIRGGRHYRSFRCCGPDGTGKLIKEWNVVERAAGIAIRGSPSWKPVHRFVSDLTNPQSRLREIDAQLRVIGVSRHPSTVTAAPAFFR